MYVEERMRKELQDAVRMEEDFLKELDLHVTVSALTQEGIARASQLTQKTNQFNVTTRRYSEEDMVRLLGHGWKIWTVGVTDRFGNYGTVGVLMAEPHEAEWRIDTFLLSCRVLGRHVEDRVIEYILDIALSERVTRITAEYRPSAKNQQTEYFWEGRGFTLTSEDKEHKMYQK